MGRMWGFGRGGAMGRGIEVAEIGIYEGCKGGRNREGSESAVRT